MNRILILTVSLLLHSCGSVAQKPSQSALQAEEKTTEQVKEPTAVPEAKFVSKGRLSSKDLPSEAKYRGRTVEILSWSDVKGENYAIFSMRNPSNNRNKAASLFVYHYRRHVNRLELVRLVREHMSECDVDRRFEFIEDTISITDLDADDLGEISFAYARACRGDVSPSAMKLFVLEDGKKYALRGETLVMAGTDMEEGGDYRVDPAFKQAPAAFLRHAERLWKAHRVEDSGR